MAGVNVPGIDIGEDGIVKSGRFVGYHINDVMQYLEHLEKASAEGTPAAEPPPPPPPPDPKATLEARAGARVDNVNQMAQATALRLEQDDEESFASTVGDYDQWRAKVAEIKKTTNPELRMQKGYHRQVYLFLKSQDPAVARQLLGQPPLEEPEPEEPEAEPEAPPPPVAPPPPAPKATPVPPASAKATPAARAAAPATKASKLTATPKLAQMAAGMGMSTEAYLLKLEAEGVSQDTINAMSQGQVNGAPGGRRRTVFDSNV